MGKWLRNVGWLRKLANRDSGQTLVETALTVPLLSLLLLGAVEFGRAAYAAIEVTNAANAGAFYGATTGDLSGIQRAAQNDAGNLNGLTATGSFTYTCSDGSVYSDSTQCPAAGAHVITVLTVNTSFNFNLLVQAPGFGGGFTMTGQAVEDVLPQ